MDFASKLRIKSIELQMVTILQLDAHILSAALKFTGTDGASVMPASYIRLIAGASTLISTGSSVTDRLKFSKKQPLIRNLDWAINANVSIGRLEPIAY